MGCTLYSDDMFSYGTFSGGMYCDRVFSDWDVRVQ